MEACKRCCAVIDGRSWCWCGAVVCRDCYNTSIAEGARACSDCWEEPGARREAEAKMIDYIIGHSAVLATEAILIKLSALEEKMELGCIKCGGNR